MTDIINEYDNTNVDVICPVCGDYHIHVYNKKTNGGDYRAYTVRCNVCSYDDSMTEKMAKILRLNITGSSSLKLFVLNPVGDYDQLISDILSIGWFEGDSQWLSRYYWMNHGIIDYHNFELQCDEGKHIDHFELDGKNIGSSMPTITMDKDHDLVAVVVPD